MAKQMFVTDPSTGVKYTLEFTRKSIETMEKQGFLVSEVPAKPMTMLPALFAGAFLAHHRFVQRPVIDKIYEGLGKKEQLIEKLVEMYNEPLMALLGSDEEELEGNANWETDW